MINKLSFGLIKTQDAKSFMRLIADIRLYRSRIIIALLATIGVAFAEGYLAAFIAPLINQGFASDAMNPPVMEHGMLGSINYYRKWFVYTIWGTDSKVWVVPLFLISLMLFRGACRFISSYNLSWVGSTMLLKLRERVFQKMLLLPANYHQATPSSTVLARTFGNAGIAIGNAINVFITMTRDSLIVLFLVATLIYLNWTLALTILIIFPLMAMVSKSYRRRLRHFNIENQRHNAALSHTVQEVYDGYKVVKLFDGAPSASQRFREQNLALLHYSKKLAQADSARSPITELIASFGLAFVIFIALWQSQKGLTTVGEFMAFIVAMLQMISPLKNLSSLSVPMQSMFVSSDIVCEFLDEPDEPNTGHEQLPKNTANIEFKHVGLRYSGQSTDALNDFNLSIASGEKIALVGRSGSGKTSLTNIMLRFAQPSTGEVLLGGVPIERVDIYNLRAHFSLVSQDVFLFSGSLYGNVKYGKPDATEAEIEAALRAANLWDWVSSQPDGWHTEIGTNGSQLSGGQRQRVSIARAILKDAPILILDEATSALDNESERAVQKALDLLMHGRTSIMIAHRLSTIEKADRIIVMDAGKIIEQGAHEELLAQNGLYARLSALPSLAHS